MLGVLRIRDYRLLLAGQLLSNIGDWLLLVAAPYFVFELTGSTLATGLTLTAESVPAIVLGPLAAALIAASAGTSLLMPQRMRVLRRRSSCLPQTADATSAEGADPI